MKTNGILMIAAAGALLAGCAGVSDVTRISGKVTVDAVDEVNVVVPEMEINSMSRFLPIHGLSAALRLQATVSSSFRTGQR